MSHAEIRASLLMQELRLCYLGSVNISGDRKVKKPKAEGSDWHVKDSGSEKDS